jgi:hypothetical protein
LKNTFRPFRSEVRVGDVYVYDKGKPHESMHVILDVEYNQKLRVKKELRFRILIITGPRIGETSWSIWQPASSRVSPFEELVARGHAPR